MLTILHLPKIIIIRQVVVITKVADPPLSIQDFISSNNLGDSGVIQPDITNCLSLQGFPYHYNT